jgi:hypothetical protein
MSYLYSLPTTGAIKFTNLISDPTNAHVSDLARATNARNRVRAVLKETRRAEGGNKDWMACANVRNFGLLLLVVVFRRWDIEADRAIHLCVRQAIQDYLPHLLAMMRCTEDDGLLLKGLPRTFHARAALSCNRS